MRMRATSRSIESVLASLGVSFDPQRQTVLSPLFATPVLTQYAHIAKTRPPFPRRFAAFYENSKKKMKKPSLDCLSAPSILESRAARAGTADRAGLAPRTDRRAHANPSDWSGRDSNEMFGATYARARSTRFPRSAHSGSPASIRSVVVTRAGVFPDRDRVSTLRLSSAIRSSAARIVTPRTRRAVTSRSRPRGTSGVSRS